MDEECDSSEQAALPLAKVVAAARRGASSVMRDSQMVADATEVALHRYEEALIAGKHVGNWLGWAFRTGANAAKKLGKASGGASRRLEALSEEIVVGVAAWDVRQQHRRPRTASRGATATATARRCWWTRRARPPATIRRSPVWRSG